MTFRYVIVPTGTATADMVSAGGVTSLSTARKSLDGASVIFKYQGAKPAVFTGVTDYSHAEILAVLEGEDWTDPE